MSSWNSTISIWPTTAEKNPSLIEKRVLIGSKKPRQRPRRNVYSRFGEKKIMNRPATLYEILMVKSSASKDQIKKHYHKKGLLTHPDAGGDEQFFKTINREYQILTNDAEREAYNIFG